MQNPTSGGDKDQHERAQQLGEKPAPLQARIVKVLTVTELQPEQMPATWTQEPETGSLLLRHMLIRHDPTSLKGQTPEARSILTDNPG